MKKSLLLLLLFVTFSIALINAKEVEKTQLTKVKQIDTKTDDNSEFAQEKTVSVTSISEIKSISIIKETNAAGFEQKDVYQLEPLIVSASTHEMVESASIASITVITAEEIKNKKVHHLNELLRSVNGLDITTSGGVGKLSTVFIRGAASERTLVMINGVPVNDPSAPGRTTDLSKLTLDNVERVEIVRGGQSVAFGASAMGGIINIITKKAIEPLAGEFVISGGKYQSLITQLNARVRVDRFGVALAVSLENAQGFSVAKRSKDANENSTTPLPVMDEDGYRNLTIDLNTDYKVSDQVGIELENRYIKGDNELDNFGGDYGDDINFTDRFTQTINRIKTDIKLFDDKWQQSIVVGMSQNDRVTNNPDDFEHFGEAGYSEWRARNIMVDWRNTLDLPLGNQLVIGGGYYQEQAMGHNISEYELYDWATFAYLGHVIDETYFDVRSTHRFNAYVEDYFIWQNFSVLAGFRFIEHDQFGSHIIYRVSPAYLINQSGTKIRTSYGTGFNTPSIYQLYVNDAYSQGDQALMPETSTGWEIGIDQNLLGKKVVIGLTYFQIDYNDQISAPFDNTIFKYVYENINKAETKGWEAFVKTALVDNLEIAINYSKLTANDLTNEDTTGKEPLLRRADYKFGVNMNYIIDNFIINADAAYIGSRWDKYYDNTVNAIVKSMLDPYMLVNLAVSYQLLPTIEVFVRIHNLLDEDYEDIAGYTTSRFNTIIGTTIQLP